MYPQTVDTNTILGNNPKQIDKKTYYMIAAEVIYGISSPIDGTDPTSPTNMTEIGARHLNCLVISKDDQFGMAQIGQAHMGIQNQFLLKVTDPSAQIIDMTIISMMRLGRFTEEEFKYVPKQKTDA